MTLTNHYMTGVGIAIITKNPYIALPLATSSHYLLDSLPHYGFRDWESRDKKIFRTMLVIDVFVFVLLLNFLIEASVPNWYYLAGFFGYLPDVAWIYIWIGPEKFGTIKSTRENAINKFHSNIQSFERVWGIIPEIIYGLVMFSLLRGALV